MQKLKIKPNDTLFFRDGKPFTMGDESFASGVFPPAPSVFYGVIRSIWFAEHPEAFSRANKGKEDPTSNLSISALFLSEEKLDAKGGESQSQLLMPLPLDVEVDKESGQGCLLHVEEKGGVVTNSISPYLLISSFSGKGKDLTEAFLTAAPFKQYLQGQWNPNNASDLQDLREEVRMKEPKIGLKRDPSLRIADEGHLYAMEMSRPQTQLSRLSFEVGIEDLQVNTPVTTRIGGEGKTAQVETILQESGVFTRPEIDNEYLKMYLATPGVFAEGWHPPLPKGVQVIAASLGKVQNIGGFDMKKRQPKPMLKAIQPGAVYFLKGHKDALNELLTKSHGKSLCQPINEIDYAREGFGLVYFAKCHESQIQSLKK